MSLTRTLMFALVGFSLLRSECSVVSEAQEVAFPELPKGAWIIDDDAPKTFTKTESGLKYRILRKGDGLMPKAADTVLVNCHGWLDDGKVFDSSYKRGEPISYSLMTSGGIKGLTEGIQLVGTGGMIELEIPAELGFGARGNPGTIPPNATLHGLVELLAVWPEKDPTRASKFALVEYATKCLFFARANPNDPKAASALSFAVVCSRSGPIFDQAVKLLVENHIDSPDITTLFTVFDNPEPQAEQALLAIADKSKNRQFQGLALMRLADLFSTAAGLEGSVGKSQKAIALLERVVKDYGDVDSYARVKIGEQAQAELTNLQKFGVGQIAPEIRAEGIDGVVFKLSDYRGKVVMLDFWGQWSQRQGMYEHERSLVQRLTGKPFVLIGVNSDSIHTLNKIMEDKSITWRSFWDKGTGSPKGPISAEWGVGAWPTVYVLDGEGRIRYKSIGSLGGVMLDWRIDALLAEAAQGE